MTVGSTAVVSDVFDTQSFRSPIFELFVRLSSVGRRMRLATFNKIHKKTHGEDGLESVRATSNAPRRVFQTKAGNQPQRESNNCGRFCFSCHRTGISAMMSFLNTHVIHVPEGLDAGMVRDDDQKQDFVCDIGRTYVAT